MLLFVILIFHCVVNCCVYSKELTSVIRTDKGPVQGEILKTVRKSIEFSSFRGIRYGKAPTGLSRFKPPEEAEPWSEIFDATKEGIPCPQVDMFLNAIYVNEDCLNLNVYSPKTRFNHTHKELLPVMVWIYGGSFDFGNTDTRMYGPDFLIENEVVVVAMNYRVGILGFLSLDHRDATGNAGLKDQQLALKWVQRNIEYFGGNPNSVTIFGQSAGAVSVDYHAMADGSQGLFHRSISMSGSSLGLYALSLEDRARSHAFLVGNRLGINATNSEQLLEGLYQQSAYDLVMAAKNMTLVDPPFKPTLEKFEIAGDTAFLSECSVNKYKCGNFARVPSITGFMASEFLGFTAGLPKENDAGIKTISKDDVLDFVLHSYDMDASISVGFNAITNDTFDEIVQILSDVLFVSGIDTKQKYLSRYTPAYYYRISFAPNASFHRSFAGINRKGASHADDLAYYWYISFLDFPTDPKDPFVIMQDRISRMWTNFAKFSNPTPLGEADSLLNISWPVSGSKGLHLEINDEFSVGDRPVDHITKRHQEIAEPDLSLINGCPSIKSA